MRKKNQEMVFQLLFSCDLGDSRGEDLIPCLMDLLMISRKQVRIALAKSHAIWEKREILDQKVEMAAESFSFNQIQPIEKNILRLALYDMLIEKKVAPKIAITEALRLCRKFSTPELGSFVNAILDIYYVQPTVSPPEREAIK